MSGKKPQGNKASEFAPFHHPNHKKPRTRRELIAQGFLGLGAAIAMPGLLTLLTERRAYGAPSCGALGAGVNNLPFLIYDLAGGAALAYNNVLVGTTADQGANSNFLDDKAAATLGIPSQFNPRNDGALVDNELGLLFHARSPFLAGFRSSTSAPTRANMDGVVFCTRSADDTGNNPLNPAHWIAHFGTRGTLVDIIGNGSETNLSKGNSRIPDESTGAFATASIKSPTDAPSLVNKGALSQFSAAQSEKIIKASQQLSSSQLAKFNAKALPDQIKQLVDCGYIKYVDNTTQFNADSLDVSKDTAANQARAVNNIGTDTRIPQGYQANNENSEIVCTLAKLVLDGYAGIGTITGSGYDYHGQGRQTQNNKDFLAGRDAGFCFEMARIKQKPLVMLFFTDGAVSAGINVDNSQIGGGMYNFDADDGTKSSAFMLVYNPTGKPESTGIRQIGSFKSDTGSVNESTLIGNSVLNLTKAITLNYLALHGKEGELSSVTGNNPFGQDIAKFIAFSKIK